MPRIETEEQAREVLATHTNDQPAGDADVVPAGWRFHNVRGYLATVTHDGEVIHEEGVEDEA